MWVRDVELSPSCLPVLDQRWQPDGAVTPRCSGRGSFPRFLVRAGCGGGTVGGGWESFSMQATGFDADGVVGDAGCGVGSAGGAGGGGGGAVRAGGGVRGPASRPRRCRPRARAAGGGAGGAGRRGGDAGGGGVLFRGAGGADADVAVLGAPVRGGRVRCPAPAAADLGARRTPGGAGGQRPVGGGADPAPLTRGGGVRGRGDGGVRGRVAALGAVRGPAGRQGGGRGPGGRGGPGAGRGGRAVRPPDPVRPSRGWPGSTCARRSGWWPGSRPRWRSWPTRWPRSATPTPRSCGG